MNSLYVCHACSVTFIFVPGHAGINSDERADCIASKATMVNGKTMDQVIRDTGQIRCSGCELNSTCLSRLLQLGVILGAVKNEHQTGGR